MYHTEPSKRIIIIQEFERKVFAIMQAKFDEFQHKLREKLTMVKYGGMKGEYFKKIKVSNITRKIKEHKTWH